MKSVYVYMIFEDGETKIFKNVRKVEIYTKIDGD